jgi:uncharacterized protein
MEKLILKHREKVSLVPMQFVRDYGKKIHWDDRLISIRGHRGIGKTTLLLQYIKKNFGVSEKCLYVSLDDLYFSTHTLIYLAEEFRTNGGTHLFLDEVHRYPNWAQEIKNLYDDYPDLHIVFTGSSIIQIRNSNADLSRRAAFYELPGLSFREYIRFATEMEFSALQLDEILTSHTDLAFEIKSKLKPIPLFKDYLEYGYFPFFKEYHQTFSQRLEETIHVTLDSDMLFLKELNLFGIAKMKQLLMIIAGSVPFRPNISKLSERIGINRNTLTSYIKHLEQAGIITGLYYESTGISQLQRPEKIYLHNPNYCYALAQIKPEKGNLRETFFINQITVTKHLITYTDSGDFMIDNKYTFEVGGADKTYKQIRNIDNSYIAADDIEAGIKNKIPLWLFGFLY